MEKDILIVRQVVFKGIIDLLSHGVLNAEIANDTQKLEEKITEYADAILDTKTQSPSEDVRQQSAL